MTCGYCGTELPTSALFCGVCGRSLASSAGRTVTVAAAPLVRPANDTAIIDLADLEELVEPEPAPEPEPDPEPEPEPEPVVIDEAPVAPESEPWKPRTRLLSSPTSIDDDLERTRIVSTSLTGARFVLQFSTGESLTVAGSGLVGRNPTPEPAEYFDHVVTIVDPGKSVSKTHLEFGQVSGAFWVADRFSGNGTVIREPDNPPRRCDPGKRYRVARGTRVTMGEQFFVVS